MIRNGLRWRNVSKECSPHKTLYNRFVRWSRLGVFDRIFAALAGAAGEPDVIMIHSTYLKAHRTTASPLKCHDVPRRIGPTKSAGLMLDALPRAAVLISDKGYDSRRFRDRC